VLFWVPWSLTMSRVGLEGLEVFVMRWKWEGERGVCGLAIWSGGVGDWICRRMIGFLKLC